MSWKFPVPSLLARVTDAVFVRNWTRLFGEPPAALLEDRREMLQIVVGTVPVLEYPVERRPAADRNRAEQRRQPPGLGQDQRR
jgi:hypothetical protein